MIKVLAKSTVDIEQLKERESKGAEFIELHLREGDIRDKADLLRINKNIATTNLKIKAVHVPIKREYSLEGIIRSIENMRIIENSCMLADMQSERTQELVHVVLHHELSLGQLVAWGMLAPIGEKLKYLIDKYKGITINFENLQLLNFDEASMQARNSFSFQNVELCIMFRSLISSVRLGTVLDTCHALSSIRVMKELDKKGYPQYIDLFDYFERNKQYLNVIHLSNAINLGVGIEHGTGFDTPDDEKLLTEICHLILDIEYDNVITLEVCEKDYLNCVVFSKLLKQVNRRLFQDESK